MAASYDILIKLVSNLNPCHVGHKVGDEWLWHDKTPADMCFAAFNALYPFALVLKCGGKFPWQDDPNILTVSCPDSEAVNRFEIKRVPEKTEPVESYDIGIKLVGKGAGNPCDNGHKVGAEWLWRDKTPENLCPAAYKNICDSALVLRYGGQYSWQTDPDVITVSCPDPAVLNRFEIRRINKK
ncbi:TIGR04076 family protein [Chloroflexota bacterium]